MSKDRNPKLSHFRRGVSAFAALGSPFPSLYVCPLCMRGLAEENAGLLTREHVPPRSLGGRSLVLTCYACNSEAGGKDGVDTHARSQADVMGLILRSPDRKLPVRLTVGPAGCNAELRLGQGRLEILERDGPPGEGQSVMDVFNRMMKEDEYREPLTLSLPYAGFKAGWPEISWLRAAYLAVFAALGYRYICREILVSVREQIHRPDVEVIKNFHTYIANRNRHQKVIMMVQDPEWVRGIAVIMDLHLIFLPMWDKDFGFYSRLESLLANPELTLAGIIVPWPKKPEFAADLALDGELMQRIFSCQPGLGITPSP